MTGISKERRQHLRERISEARSGQSFGHVTPWDDIEALLDMADERDELKNVISRLSEQRYLYRDLLESAEDVLRNAELDVMADRIDAALEGKNNG